MIEFKKENKTTPQEVKPPAMWYAPSGQAMQFYLDILQQPHTLIAGTTGSGKSCAMNGIIYTALYSSPSRALFVLIDPKFMELAMYKNLPHTIAYTTDPADAHRILKNVCNIIKDRCQRATEQGLKKSNEEDIYVFIDELSDLILSEYGIVDTLGKIARIGRAANVHLIAATQCPNRKTLSAEFAANCPARLGLRCRDKIESRQIIGTNEAAELPLYGYAYYQAPQFLTPQLVKLPYYTDSELSERVRWWTKQEEELNQN